MRTASVTQIPALVLGTSIVLVLACAPAPDDSSTDTAGETGTDDTGPDGDPGVLVGSFQVELVAPVPAMGDTPATPGKTSVLGKVYDGPTPAQIIWEEAASEGDCRLLTPRVPFCDTPCGGSAVCVEDNTCQDYPTAHGVGTVTVTGVKTEAGASEFTMEPVVNTYQPAGGVKLLYPGFGEGDEIGVAAGGDYYGAFEIAARGVAPLALTSDALELVADAPLALTWTPAGQADLSTIHVKLDISHHGGTKGMITCESADDGALDLPAALVTELLDLGVAGFPSIVVRREAVGATTIEPGRVELVVSTSVERFVQIDGLVSCTDDSQCSGGQTCQPDLTCG